MGVDRTPNNDWSDRDLQVFDLKAAVALSSTCVIEAGRTGSRRIMLAVPCMHHMHLLAGTADASVADGKQT